MEALRRTLVQPIDRRNALLCLALLGLNLLDAFATLRHLAHGATELNPLMELLLRRGACSFLLFKHLLASVGVLGIALHPEPRAARWALYVLLPLYLLLDLYQIALFYVT